MVILSRFLRTFVLLIIGYRSPEWLCFRALYLEIMFQEKKKKNASESMHSFGDLFLLRIHLIFFVVLVVNYLFFDLFDKTIGFLERVFDISCMIKIGGSGGDVQRCHPCLRQVSNVAETKISVVITHITFETGPC